MKEKLTNLLDKNKTVLFVGIGNLLKHDDGIGVYISNNIKNSSRIQSISAELSIENYIGKINQIHSQVLVLVDCVSFNEKPGFADIVPVDQLLDYTTNTHNISLKRIAEFFTMPVKVMGIQPGNVSFGEGFTPEVKATADEILQVINEK